MAELPEGQGGRLFAGKTEITNFQLSQALKQIPVIADAMKLPAYFIAIYQLTHPQQTA